MPTNDFWQIVGWALACSVPVVLAGAIIIRLARSLSLAVSMVALVLIRRWPRSPACWAPAVHDHPDVRADRRRAGDRVGGDDPRCGDVGALPGQENGVGAGDPRFRAGGRAVATPAGRIRQPRFAHAAGRDPRGVRGDRRRRGADDEVRVHAKTIEQESIRLSEMVDDLFEMSKINAGAVQPAFDKVALDEVVDDVLAAHRIAAERAGVVLKAELPDKPVRVVGSDRALVRVLSNLVANAIAHTPAGGKVSLALGSDEDGAWARVDDTGVGIDEADLPRVFDVAYRGSNDRVPRSDSSLPSGSGLGLAIAAGLVQAHRGTLSAHNLGTGARFEVRLPLAD